MQAQSVPTPRRELSVALKDEHGGIHRLNFMFPENAEAEFWAPYLEQLATVVQVQARLNGHHVEYAGFYKVDSNGRRDA